jgi:hypothetical protein
MTEENSGNCMTPSVNRSIYDYLGVGSLLACIAGIVNAVGFIGFGGFVTHVSGNATRASVELLKNPSGFLNEQDGETRLVLLN